MWGKHFWCCVGFSPSICNSNLRTALTKNQELDHCIMECQIYGKLYLMVRDTPFSKGVPFDWQGSWGNSLISVADANPNPLPFWSLDPGWTSRIILATIFWVKILKNFYGDPGSTTLNFTHFNTLTNILTNKKTGCDWFTWWCWCLKRGLAWRGADWSGRHPRPLHRLPPHPPGRSGCSASAAALRSSSSRICIKHISCNLLPGLKNMLLYAVLISYYRTSNTQKIDEKICLADRCFFCKI